MLVIGILEGVATAILFIAINFSAGNILIVAMGILTASVFSGKLTGAHLNPTLTLAVLICEGFDKITVNLKLTFVMIFSQIIGGFAGSYFSLLFLG